VGLWHAQEQASTLEGGVDYSHGSSDELQQYNDASHVSSDELQRYKDADRLAADMREACGGVPVIRNPSTSRHFNVLLVRTPSHECM
jgi:hypothetical protein